VWTIEADGDGGADADSVNERLFARTDGGVADVVRDNHEGCPEIVDAYERDGQYYGALKIVCSNETATVEFGVSEDGYVAMKRILGTRPFDQMPNIPHRYFFCGSYSAKPQQESCEFRIRVEQGTTAKSFDFKGSKSLLANLLWFQKLKTIEETLGLRRLDESGGPLTIN
jgi:hypothetical protein